MSSDASGLSSAQPPESFEEFLNTSRIGYIYAAPDGKILRVNARIASWLDVRPHALVGTRISDHLPISGKVYFETHLLPLLRMQGYFDEVALELAPADAPRIPVIVSGVERSDDTGTPLFMRLAILQAVQRRQYERSLASAKAQAVSDNSKLRGQVAEESQGRLKAESDLSDACQSADLREQFIAVLGHDLRNPLAAISGAMRLIVKTPLNERALAIADMVNKSVGRMAALIDNVMDFARGRLGGGLELSRRSADLGPVLSHVIAELKINTPDREIATDISLAQPVFCDANRIAQLFSNLLANALTHGAATGPVRIGARTADGQFELYVGNTGDPIPPAALERLFQPFTREDVRPSQQGLGLGLYIASEIARAHDGSLTVASSPEETRFTFRMPQQRTSAR